MAKHIKSLTPLRGVAALLVLMHHAFGFLLPRLGQTVSSYSKFFDNGYLWVDFFFILSGFIITHVYINHFSSGVKLSSYRSYLFSRFARIYPLHIFMIFLFIGLEFTKIVYLLFINVFGLDLPTGSFIPFAEKTNLTALFTNIFLVQALDGSNTYWNEPAWSISAEWIVYLIFPFLLFALSKTKKIISASLFYIYALACLFILIEFTYGHLDIIGIPSIVRCTTECVIGFLIYKLYHSGNYRNFLGLNSTTFVSAIWIFIVMHYDLHDILIIPAFSLLILSASINNRLISKIINSNLMIYIGAISYSIYMVHWFIQELIKLAWKNLFDVPFGSQFNEYYSWISLIVYILIVVLTASFTYKFIEMPMRKKLKETRFYCYIINDHDPEQ